MNIESIDAGGDAQELKEKLVDLAGGDISTSVLANEKIQQKPDYKLTGGRKFVGDCHIFDYQKFKKGGKHRPGSEHDVARLKHDFKALNFDVHDYLNFTKKRTLKTLKAAALKDHSQSEYFVCCFLTHGEEGKLLMHNKCIKIDSILQCFSRSSCETLSGKPKIFIFQACRGDFGEEGVPIVSADVGPIESTDIGPIDSADVDSIDLADEDSIDLADDDSIDLADDDSIDSTGGDSVDSADDDSVDSADDDSTDMGAANSAFCSIEDNPDYLDFLIAYSTYEGTCSFKTLDPCGNRFNHGSFYIDELCRTLEQFSDELDLLQILTIANYRVAYLFQTQKSKDKKYSHKKQMPGFASRLRTEVIFNKKIRMFESRHTRYFDDRRKKTNPGLKSTKNPSGDKKTYNIQSPKRIMFLSLLNMKNNFEKDLKYCSAMLWSSVASKDYQRKDKKDWSEDELTNFLKEVAGGDFSNTDCLICFIACKAKGDYLCDVEGNQFSKPMRQIVEQFTGEKCPNLKQKPKIFIFMLSPPAKRPLSPCIAADGTDDVSSGITIPVHSDILETVITFQEPWQLEGVTDKLSIILGQESSEDFLSQLTRMNDELVRDYGFYSPSNKNLATFCVNSTLTKKINIK